MNIDDFRIKVLAVAEKAKIATDNISTPEQIKPLGNILSSLTIISEFVDDELNISVLKKNCLNSNGESEQCPLGVVCKNVWVKLDEIDQLLKPTLGSGTNVVHLTST